MTDEPIVHRYNMRNPRIQIFYWIVGAAVLVLAMGLAYRQLFEHAALKQKEKRQAQRLIVYPGPRGAIFDRNGELLVGNRPRFSAVIFPDDLNLLRSNEFYPEFVRRRDAVIEAQAAGKDVKFDYNETVWEARLSVLQRYLGTINDLTGRNESMALRDLRKHYRENLLLPLTLVHDLSPTEYARLIENLPANSPIKIYTENARFYPQGNTAAHAIGYVVSRYLEEPESDLPTEELMTFKMKGKLGRAGMERYFNDHLTGSSGAEIYQVDKRGYREDRVEFRVPRKGQDLVTSLDIKIQAAAEDAIGDLTGAAVALDVKTGEIFALASKPDYNLNDLTPFISTEVYSQIEEKGAWLNRATQGLYPPGSTFKLITAHSILRHEIIQPETRLESGKYFLVSNRLFPCHSPSGFGVIDVSQALSVSANVFFYRTGIDLGIDRMSTEAKRFGIDAPVDLEIPFMARRMIVPTKPWKRQNGHGGWVPGDTANTSIGQGYLLTTPLHMALATASIARNETRTQPTLRRLSATETVDHGGEPIGLEPEDRSAILRGMEMCIESGTGKLVKIPGIRIGGKTGTAEVTIDGQESTLAWFVGFAPIDDPEIAVCVMIEGTEPGDNFHGGSTAGPIAHDIFKTYFEQNPALEVALTN
ncbi:MAG: penicillin-binding transpeptidase domain-containing protein [Verrucomicrobiota bacterium]